jgi:hypothetical protein
MRLTIEEQKMIARKATWYFDCYFGMGTDDSVVFTGDGVDDLEMLLARLTSAIAHGGIGVKSRFQVDTGSQYSDWKPFDLEDVYAIRNYYIELYGDVPKPPQKKGKGAAIGAKRHLTPVRRFTARFDG